MNDNGWISAILAIRLPLYPGLRIRLISEFSSELVRSVMAGDLNLAVVTAPPEDSRIITAAFARTHLYAALPHTHAAAQKEDVALHDLAGDEWILFARRAHPVLHDAIMDAAQGEGIAPKYSHDIHTAEPAVHLVSEHVGVAILTKPGVGVSAQGVVVSERERVLNRSRSETPHSDGRNNSDQLVRLFLCVWLPEAFSCARRMCWLCASIP